MSETMLQPESPNLKTLRKTDPVAAQRLQRLLKKRRQKERRKQAKLSCKQAPVRDYGVPPVVSEEELKTLAQEGDALEAELEYVAPDLDQQIESVKQFFEPKPLVKGEDEIVADNGSSTESEGDDVEPSKMSDKSKANEMDSVAQEFADIFARYESLCQREYMKVTEEDFSLLEEDIGEDDPEAAMERERLMLKFEEEVNANKLDQPEKKKTKEPVSRKRLKQLIRPAVSVLKMQCTRPDCVEVWDSTAPDPHTLVWLKAYRNTVKVPAHWNQKRKYLSGKRAIEKPPFRLPEYIEATKIGEIRAAILERESQKSLKQKQREKSRPKSNRMHVDFQTLHDAFFKYATKPPMTKFGDIYYEGKEREEKTRTFKPGHLSSRLKEALGLVLSSTPPPWLLLMQRYGPPPSYSNIKVPGLNTPLPSGAQWGFHAGGWGKPPTDQFGNPLYPGVFAEAAPPVDQEPRDLAPPTYWGALVEALSDSDEENSTDADMDEAGGSTAQLEPEGKPPVPDESLAPPSDPSSLAELQTAQMGLNLVQAAPSGLLPISAAATSGTHSIISAGMATPMSAMGLGGLMTPSALLNAGVATPVSVAPSVPPSEFSPESIKEELRRHDEAARKAKEAAGQIEEVPAPEDAAKKKKKRQFKF
eukprot:Gregarina_sp_Poly_1__10188@NODE_700_length_6689_cov_270_629719_g528_i0_p2_GENE_NODE_700_length_6689_cov_270_629719_g528_i0NODE_700_length_6689_cov_270_629719_g528_i0_p2_ORF_typecomplete_len645_score138_27DUF382/PF04037_13/1_8e04DUF382/PF04037_13/4_3e03DUF382/PF04037_13/4_4e57PSP/PF04046_16/1_7e04PSP/PF04046_16/2_7e14DUF2967/PF11179_8/0_17Joubert/PF15392_6/1_8e02Joubert/PF15392_6/4_4e03Joubert/PF15392_6/0_11_NODE_700_length_6689_cov_270_629719_g528_i025314465